MRTPILFSIAISIFFSTLNFGQLTVKDQELTPNILLQVNDEGTAGSIFLPTVGSSLTGLKLYNYGGNLFWGSNQLGLAGSAGGWTDGGSNVYTTSSSDKVGIGISSPSASLQVDGNDGVLFTGTYESGTIPIEGAGTRMMWYPKKAAFRVGRLYDSRSTFWNDDSIGEYSIAMGENTKAKGLGSTAIGSYTEANGLYSRAIGTATEANGWHSTAIGFYVKSDAYNSFAIGSWNIGGGNPNSWVSTDPLFELGNGIQTSRQNAFTVLKNGMVGIGTHSPQAKLHLRGVHFPNSFIYLESDATKDAGFRLMEDGITKWHIFNNGADQALNIRNSSYAPLIIINQVSGYIGINKLFPARLLHLKQLAANRGLRIEHQSTTDFWENGIGTTTNNYKFYYNNIFRADISSVDGAYTQSSDSRLKKNIESISSVLDKVVQLNPAEYNFKESSDNTPKSIGFIAQEVEQIFPDLVRDLDDGYKGVVYDGFAVLAIKAIKEQQEMITSQGELITKMQAEIDELKNIVSKQ